MVVTWLAVITQAPRSAAKQADLMQDAEKFVANEIYVKALPLLKEAAEIKTKNTEAVQKQLYLCYMALDDSQNAINLFQAMVDNSTADAEVYLSLAKEKRNRSDFKASIALLEEGISKFDAPELKDEYEAMRYQYSRKYNGYDEMSAFYNGYAVAMLEGKYGVVSASGEDVFGFKYDKLSVFSEEGKAYAIDDGTAVIINSNGQRLAVSDNAIEDFVAMANGIGAVKYDEAWHFADSELRVGKNAYDYIGALNSGLRAVSETGKWFLFNAKNEPVTPAFDEIKIDGRAVAYANERAFARQGEKWIMIDSKGTPVGKAQYDDARPFSDGAAAVKIGDAWQFVDKNGNVVLTGDFTDAQSFSSGLAAVKVGEKWGFINEKGAWVINAEYEAVNSFVNGIGSINENGVWHVYVLKKYEK
ncbi:MAG: WG repeat-containing protein [Christensenella sp.]